MEAQPNVVKLTNLGVVLAPPQIDDVGDAEGPKLLDGAPAGDGAAKPQPLIDGLQLLCC